MKHIINWFHDLALCHKITYMVIIAGIIPISIIFMVSTINLKKSSVEMQMYMLNKGYDQTYQSIEAFLSRIYNVSTLAAVNDYILTALKLKNSNLTDAEELLEFEKVSSYAYSLELNMDEINILYYIDDAFLMANRRNSMFRPISGMKNQDWSRALQLHNGNPTWVLMNERNRYLKTVDYFGSVRELWDNDDFTSSLGTVAVVTEVSKIKKMMIASLADQVFYIQTVDGKVIGSNDELGKYVNSIDVVHLNISKKFGEVLIDNIPYYVRSTAVDDSNLYFVSVIPKISLYSDTARINIEMLLWYILVCVLLYFISVVISRPITSRIKLLDKKMTEDGMLHTLEVVPHKDEIGHLIMRYNDMVQKIELLLDEQFLMGQEKIGAELKALQSQINPHFLYNTLDMLNWMARKNESDNIQDILQAMSAFYRMVLSKGQDNIRIGDEISMCEAYIKIQTTRFKGRIRFEIDVEPELLEFLIPKITLQPLIENAIIHGINEKTDGRGKIILSGWSEEERIILSVTDDGAGIKKAENSSSNSNGSHYGMSNIEKRLSLFYGENIKLQIDSSLGIGTCVSLDIPMRK